MVHKYNRAVSRHVIPTLLCCCLLAAAMLAIPQPACAAGIPAVSDADIEQALALAGSNRPQLESALEQSTDDMLRRGAMRFVVASLPTCDLGSITATELSGNLDMALAARNDFAWGEDCDLATWAHFVLPP